MGGVWGSGGGLQPGGWVYSSGPPPPYNSEGFLGWAPATPSFFAHRSLVWLFTGAPCRFVVVQAPCQNLFVVVGYSLDPQNRQKGST